MVSASRFFEVSEDEIEYLLESATPEKTKNVSCKVCFYYHHMKIIYKYR